MAFSWPQDGLTGAGILLRAWTTDDLPARRELETDPGIRRWSPAFPPLGEDDVTRHLAVAVQAGLDGTAQQYVIADPAEPAAALGGIDWRQDLPCPPFSIADVGYSVLEQARGRGVASRALRLLTGWLLSGDGADLHRVQLDHAVENVASCRTAQRAGFAPEGIRPAYLPLRAHPDAPVLFHDTCLHGVRRGALSR